MKSIPLRDFARLSALCTLPLLFACASNNDSTVGGAGGSAAKGGSGGGTSSSSGGSGGVTSTASGGSGGTASAGTDSGVAATGCGKGRTAASGAVIEDFDGKSQVTVWLLADKANTKGMEVKPTGELKVPVTGPETLALGGLATWDSMDRPCMDGSAFQGIQFKVSGNVASLLFRIGTPATYPTEDGGTCTSAADCGYAHYNKDVTSSLAAGGMVQVPFASLTPAWGKPAPFDKSALISLVFLTLDTDTTKSFTIDNISFY